MPHYEQQERDGSGRWIYGIESAERDAEACRLLARGQTYQQISDALGYGDKKNAYRGVQRALAAVPVESVDELRRVQCDQLDYLTVKALEVLEAKHYATSSHGELILAPGGEHYLTDDAPVLNAIDRLLRIFERRAKLLGLDAPARLEVMTLDYLDAQIREASEQLARAAAAEAAAASGA